ncbi:PP2C family protein-serine/threonine phosphatase [Kitasatospora sp. NPDC059088]|uniref:PP2C family protein-serine/threonine phosphatase n=1 Tax=Kitasatospora sp. NPDC059088 TaxID=3346722 RepID=UPI0036BE807E
MAEHEEAAARPVHSSTVNEASLEVVRRVLAGLPGSVAFLVPEFGPSGEVEDLRFAAASPRAVDIGGRRGSDLVGLTVLQTYPAVAGTDLWRGYLRVLATETAWEGDLEYEEAAAGIPHRSRYRVCATPCEGGLVVSWNRLDRREREQRRLDVMQRLGNMGWVDRDLVRGAIAWSDEVYSIFDRDRSLGPLALEELSAYADIEDRPALVEAVQRLLKSGESADCTFGVHLPHGRTRHVRVVMEAETDAQGQPVQLYGFFQDLSEAKQTEQQLLEHEQNALAQQALLAAERDLAARLQNTLLPVPEQTLQVAGLTVDIAYQPLQEGLNLGGDWYSAIELPDESALFVVGDVAGHGLDAVATMALLRFTAKGMAMTGTPLPVVLARLNALLLHATGRESRTATMIMARYEPAACRLSWVGAGHLPPLLLRDGEARFLPALGGILLGATPTARYEVASLDLTEGDHVLLYTDGLVERAGEPIDEGLARLARAALLCAGEPGLLAALVTELVARDSRHDDVCALHIRR